MAEFVRRATEEDVPFLDSIVNHPACRPFMGDGDHWITFGEAIKYGLTFRSDEGVMFGENIGDDTFMFLVAFNPEGRGLHSMLSMRECIAKCFTETECKRIIGTIQLHPGHNRKMLRAASVLGFDPPKLIGNRALIDLEYIKWSVTNPDCYQIGGAFMDEQGIEAVAPDQAGAIGAFLATASNGLMAKAVKQYELYALVTKTKPIIFSAEADRLYYGDKDITDAVMTVSGV
jgi:hypothetical protein